MDSNTIFTKTAKGLGEATGKTSALPRKLRNVLKEIDGKKKVDRLRADLGDYSESELNQIFQDLLNADYIREFVHPVGSEPAPPPRVFETKKVVGKAPAESLSGESLDFTALQREASKSLTTNRAQQKPAGPAPSPGASEAAKARKNYADGDSMVTAEAEIKAVIQAKEKAKREAEIRAAIQAKRMARNEAEEKSRRETEESAKQEAEEKAKQEAEERAKREAEEKARKEAEEKAKRETDEKARHEAEERAKREAEERAKREAEEKARREAEERARREAEEKARKEAEEKAKREAEERAKREAEEQARKEAEEKARREAEERARREAEEKARREAEEKAKREAEEKAQREAEEQARKEAEEKARREAEERARREAEEKAKREAEEKAQREAEEKVRREAEEKAKREAEKKARMEEEELAQQKAEQEIREAIQAKERTRREAEEEKARRRAEEQAKREAEEHERGETEAKAREEAEEAAKKEAEEAAKKEAEEKARESAQREAEEKARKEAEEKAAREAEERARQAEKEKELEAEAAQKALIAAAKAAKPPRAPGYWGRMISGVLLVVFVAGFAALHVMPFDEQRGQMEKMAAAQFHRPVTIKSLHFAMLPRPHWRIEGVTVGSEGQIRIERVDASAAPAAVLNSVGELPDLRLNTVVLNDEGLGWLLFGKPDQPGLKLTQASAKNIKLDSKNIVMPALDARMEIGGDGKWRKIALESVEKKISIELQPMPEAVKIDFNAGSYALPFGSSLVLDDFHASGVASSGELAVTDFSGHLLGGTLGGNARLKWGASWSLSGEASARLLDVARIATGAVEDGKLDGKAQYAFRAGDPDKLFATQHLEGNFVVRKGVLVGANFGGILQSGDTAGGKTPFSEASGGFVFDNGVVQLRQLRLGAGKISATGTARVEADKKLRGRLALELKTAAMQRSASVVLSGTLGEPHYTR